MEDGRYGYELDDKVLKEGDYIWNTLPSGEKSNAFRRIYCNLHALRCANTDEESLAHLLYLGTTVLIHLLHLTLPKHFGLWVDIHSSLKESFIKEGNTSFKAPCHRRSERDKPISIINHWATHLFARRQSEVCRFLTRRTVS
jgi:hypothetical protein